MGDEVAIHSFHLLIVYYFRMESELVHELRMYFEMIGEWKTEVILTGNKYICADVTCLCYLLFACNLLSILYSAFIC